MLVGMPTVQAWLLTQVTVRGYVSVRDHPRHDRTLRRMAEQDLLRPLLKGTYVLPGEQRLPVLARAVTHCYPDAVITGRGAARATFWPELECPRIDVARPHATRDRPPFRFHQRTMPPELIVTGTRFAITDPALTALDLCGELGGDAIDRALRQHVTTLDRLWAAFHRTSRRRGNPHRLQLLLESRSEPWSAAERRLHAILHGAGLHGWKANAPLELGDGQIYIPDVRFDRERLIIEVEGNAFHSSPTALHRDRSRQNALTLAGWRVLRIDWEMLVTDPEGVVAAIRTALRRAG